MKKTIVYNNVEVIRAEPETNQYSATSEGEYVLVQTIPLAKQMLQARGIDTSVLDLYSYWVFSDSRIDRVIFVFVSSVGS